MIYAIELKNELNNNKVIQKYKYKTAHNTFWMIGSFLKLVNTKSIKRVSRTNKKQ